MASRRAHPGEGKRKRKSRARAFAGFTSNEIYELTHVSKRRLLHWVKVGLVPKPAFHGRATRYSRSQLATIVVVKKLRSEFYLSVDEAKEYLLRMSPEAIEAMADLATLLHEAPPPAAAESAAASPAVAVEAPPVIEAPTLPAQAVEADGAATRGAHAPGYPSERWERVVLMPGLELAVRDEPVLRKIAALIYEQYALSGAR